MAERDRDKLTNEDLILYVFGALVSILLALYMYDLQEAESTRLGEFAAQLRSLAAQPADSVWTQANYIRYDFAASTVPSITSRANTAILVGTLLALMGSFLIVRGVRDSPFEAEGGAKGVFQMKFAASSPGIVLATLGCIIIGMAIWRGAPFSVDEPPLGGLAVSGFHSKKAEAEKKGDELMKVLDRKAKEE